MKIEFSVVIGVIATIILGMGVGVGNHAAHAAKVTASSYSDGYSRGVKDASRDLQGLNGHGYDSSCPSGHTSVFCSGYVKGYDNTWYGQRVSSSPPTSLAQSQSQGITNNNNPTIIINPPRVVAKAAEDVNRFNADTTGKATISGNNPPPCPLPDIKSYCDGWEKGYSDKIVDDLD